MRPQEPQLLRTALKDSPQRPPTANRQPPPTTKCQPPAAANRQPPTANRQTPTIGQQHCFCGFVSCPCLDHEAESVPVNIGFCWRYEPFFPLLKDSPDNRMSSTGGMRAPCAPCRGPMCASGETNPLHVYSESESHQNCLIGHDSGSTPALFAGRALWHAGLSLRTPALFGASWR